MGNTQSTAGGQKVAKPKTIRSVRSFTKSSSPASHYEISSPISSVPYSNASDSTIALTSPTFDGLTDQEYRQQIRSQFLSPDGVSPERQTSPQVDLLAASVARSLSRSGSRTANTISTRSSLARLQNGSQLSVATERTVDMATAVSILQELQKTASADDLAALHQALMPSPNRDSLAQKIQDDQDESGTSAAALIRRKSYAQPGVATRHAKPNTVVARKPIPAPSAHPPIWKKDMMGSSPLTRLSSLDGLEPPPSIVENRAQTPSDLEYSTLGNLKHGSLLITNGRASPVPSVASPGRIGRRLSDEDDFFTASENGSTFEHTPPPSRRAICGAENDMEGATEEPRPRTPDLSRLPAPRKRDGSPLKREVHVESLELKPDADAESVYSRHLRSTRSATSLHSRPETRFSFQDSSADEQPKAVVLPTHHRGQSHSSISLAKEYMAEIGRPPSSFITKDLEPRQVLLQRNVDEGFEETQNSPIRETVIEKPFALAPGAGQISPRKPLGSHPLPPMLDTDIPKRPVPVLAKSDSGYSSGASASVTSPLGRQRARLSTVESIPVPTFAERFPPLPNTNSVEVFMMNTTAGADQTIIESIERDLTKEEKLKRSKSWRKSMRKSLPRLLSSETTATNNSQLSLDSNVSKSEKQHKKLQKRRPLSQPPIMMNDKHALEKGPIPRVPSTVLSRYSGRLSMSPGMQFLDRTYENAMDKRRGSATPRPATAAASTIPETYFPDSYKAPVPPTHRFGFGRRSLRRAKTQVEESDDFAGVTDFGTVSESLGSSPYDIAVAGQQRRYSAVPAVPHHFTTNAPRAGPREGWDAETASKIAQQRSRERAAQNNARSDQNARRPQTGSRPMSYHEDMHNQAYGYAEQVVPRPTSSYQDNMRSRAYPTSNEPMPRPMSMHTPGPQNNAFNQRPRFNAQAGTSSPATQAPPTPPTHAPPPAPTQAPSSRPKTSGNERDRSPVKSLVDVFEQRSSAQPAPPPMPTTQKQSLPDWSSSQAVWRERRLAAQTQTSTSSVGNTTTTTTTTVTTFAPRPAIQARKSMPQMRQASSSEKLRNSDNQRNSTVLSDEGRLGRYDGGNRGHESSTAATRRDITPGTRAAKQFYGIDFGGVPYRVI